MGDHSRSERSLLGDADVEDQVFEAMVATALGQRQVEVLDCVVTTSDYDLPSITTVGRFWVSGRARLSDGAERTYRMFVKHVQAWRHSPFFAEVPREAQEFAAASVPWRTEGLIYGSDLRDRLPAGLTMPRALGVFEREPEATSIWLEEVRHRPQPWTEDRYIRAAYLLGRLAASREVAELATIGGFDWSPMHYVHGRLTHQVVPVVQSDEVWRHPLVAEAFDRDLRDRMTAAAAQTLALGEELSGMRRVTSHGDACPNNLMPGSDPQTFVVIDFGFWMPQPIGFDLGQLIAGELQLGRKPDVPLPRLDSTCLNAYHRGLQDEGLEVDVAEVARGHALQLWLFSGLSGLPVEMLDGPPNDALRRTLAHRAELSRFSLDLLDATA